jgi:hypothetical protein
MAKALALLLFSVNWWPNSENLRFFLVYLSFHFVVQNGAVAHVGPLHESVEGVKRVAFLAGKTRFVGLSGALDGTQVCEMNVS